MPTKSELARLMNVSSSLISRRVKAGMPTASLEAAVEWVAANVRHRAKPYAGPLRIEEWKASQKELAKANAKQQKMKLEQLHGKSCMKCKQRKPWFSYGSVGDVDWARSRVCDACKESTLAKYSLARRCWHCGEVKEASEFYADMGECKPCFSRYAKARAEKKRQAKTKAREAFLFEEMTAGRVCRTCKTRKPLDSFPKDAGRRLGFSTRCKACERDRHRGWVARNLDDVRAKARVRGQMRRDKFPEHCKRLRILWRSDARAKLSDWYVRHLLAAKKGVLNKANTPVMLVKVKRAHLQLLRELKEVENQ